MHYLSWNTPITVQSLDTAGLNYDSSLAYADQAGFRCGTCFDYPAYDSVMQKQLDIRIRPLIVMDATIRYPDYIGITCPDDVQRKIVNLM